MSESYNDPHVTINRVYTRKGDAGMTSLVGGQRVSKHHARIETYGTVDELNAVVGMCRVTLEGQLKEGVPAPADDGMPELPWLAEVLGRIQHELFNLGSALATLPHDLHPKQPRITAEDVTWLEEVIDRCNDLPTLRSFVLPGGCRLDAELHLARTVCRRAGASSSANARRCRPRPVRCRFG